MDKRKEIIELLKEKEPNQTTMRKMFNYFEQENKKLRKENMELQKQGKEDFNSIMAFVGKEHAKIIYLNFMNELFMLDLNIVFFIGHKGLEGTIPEIIFSNHQCVNCDSKFNEKNNIIILNRKEHDDLLIKNNNFMKKAVEKQCGHSLTTEDFNKFKDSFLDRTNGGLHFVAYCENCFNILINHKKTIITANIIQRSKYFSKFKFVKEEV